MTLPSSFVAPPARPFRRALPTLSPSKASDLVCAKRFHEKHIAKSVPLEPWSPALTYGNGLHKLFYDLYKPTSRMPVHERDITALARAAFAVQSYPQEEAFRREQDIQRAIPAAQNYLASDADALNTIRVETDERIEVGRSTGEPIPLSARFDRLVIRPDEPDTLRLIDYKTGNSNAEINLDSATLTLVVAKLTMKAEFGNKRLLLCYDYVDERGLVHREEVGTDRVRPLWQPLYERARAVYHGGDKTAVPGPHCQFCPLRLQCRPVHEVNDDLLEDLFEA